MAPSTVKQQDKPAPIAINLDTYEREGRVDVPFVFVLGKRRYVLEDAQDKDFRDLMGAMNAAQAGDFETAMTLLLDEEDREPFFANKIPIFKLQPLFEGYTQHYGLPSAGEAGASPDS